MKLIGFILASASVALAICGVQEVPLSDKLAIEAFIANKTGAFRLEAASFAAAATPTIETWFHVLSDGVSGNVPDKMLADQISVLNRDYSGNFNFVLSGVTRTLNPTLFTVDPTAGNADLAFWMGSMHRGDWGTLNIFLGNPPPPLLGVGGYPWQPTVTADWVYLRYSTLPGGEYAPFNLGRTAVHEVGHWLGLYHTFEGGCSSPGDYVDDTPAEAGAARDCALSRDSCTGPQFPGLDPVQNYMDYGSDSCMNQFTVGQFARMGTIYATYRGPLRTRVECYPTVWSPTAIYEYISYVTHEGNNYRTWWWSQGDIPSPTNPSNAWNYEGPCGALKPSTTTTTTTTKTTTKPTTTTTTTTTTKPTTSTTTTTTTKPTTSTTTTTTTKPTSTTTTTTTTKPITSSTTTTAETTTTKLTTTSNTSSTTTTTKTATTAGLTTTTEPATSTATTTAAKPTTSTIVQSATPSITTSATTATSSFPTTSPTASAQATITDPSGAPCFDEVWDPAIVYDSATHVTYKNGNFINKWWTKGETPSSTNINGVWAYNGPCGDKEVPVLTATAVSASSTTDIPASTLTKSKTSILVSPTTTTTTGTTVQTATTTSQPLTIVGGAHCSTLGSSACNGKCICGYPNVGQIWACLGIPGC